MTKREEELEQQVEELEKRLDFWMREAAKYKEKADKFSSLHIKNSLKVAELFSEIAKLKGMDNE